MTRRGRRVVVIGAGVAGLSTAALLASRGFDVEVFEARDALGGRAGSWESEGFRFDTGPSWYLMPEVFDHFFALLGTSAAEQLDLVRLDPAYRVQPEAHEPFDVRSGEREAVALFESIEPGSGARLRDYLASARDAYELATSRFLYDTYQSMAGLRDPAVLRRGPHLVKLLTRTLSAKVNDVVSDHRLRQVLGYPAVFLGGSPHSVPSLYHLMSHLDLGDSVQYPRGGFTTLVDALHRLAVEHGATVTTGAEVVRIETRDARVAGVRVRSAGREEFVAADAVVSAGDLHRTETTLLPPSLQTYPERTWRKRQPGPGALLLLLGVEGEVPALAHHTLLFARDWDASFRDVFGANPRVPDPASVYVCKPSATDPTVAPPGHENLFVLVPVPADPGLGRGGIAGTGDARIEEAADRVLAQIADWTSTPDLAERVVVRRTIAPGDFAADIGTWRGNALGLSHTLRQSGPLRPHNASRRVGGLFYAGSDVLPGIGLPLCLISAELVTKRLLGDSTPGRLPEPGAHGIAEDATRATDGA